MVDPTSDQTATDVGAPEQSHNPQFALAARGERSPISLAFLFYLVTFGGILSACLGQLGGDDTGAIKPLVLFSVIGACIGMAMSFMIGLVQFRSVRLAFLGAGCGLGVGAIGGVLARIGPSHFLQISLTTGLGVWLMIVVMCLAARRQHELSACDGR